MAIYTSPMMRKWSNGEIAIGRGKPLGQKPVLLLLLSATNPTLTALGLNSDHIGKKPETNLLDLQHLSAVHTGKNSESTLHNLLFIDFIGASPVLV
jgi:hypothetical protein